MSISWSGTGGFFQILGAIFCAQRNINGVRGSTNPSPSSDWGASGPQIRCIDTAIANIVAAHTAAQEKNYDGILSTKNGFISAQDPTMSALKALAISEVIAIVNADNPQADSTLPTAMREAIRQMKAASQTVKRCAVGQTVTAGGSNVGNAVVICSTTGRYGLPNEYSFAESLVATCIGDSKGNGSAGAAGSEPIQIVAPASNSNPLSRDWPQGSGVTVSITVIDPNTNAAANLLTNSNFETFTTPNIPDDWTILVGTPGTSIKKDTGNSYGANSTAALQFVGDGSELTSIVQPFGAGAGAGTTVSLKPATVYGVSFWVYAAATIAAGVMKLDLVDVSNTIINDDSGTANTITRDLTTLSATTWTNVTGFFRTPTNLPSTVKLRMRLSTAITSTKTLNIDFLAMGVATQLYNAGPYVAAFRASTDLLTGDTWTIAITNDRAGIFQSMFEANFSMTTMGMILPSAGGGGETISDSLVS